MEKKTLKAVLLHPKQSFILKGFIKCYNSKFLHLLQKTTYLLENSVRSLLGELDKFQTPKSWTVQKFFFYFQTVGLSYQT